MAEILIQHRRHRSVWPWLLGLLALALLPLPFLAADRDERRPARAAVVPRDTIRRDTTALRQDTTAQPAPTRTATAALDTADRTTTTASGSVVPAPSGASSTDATAFDRFIASGKPNANEREFVGFTAEGLRHLADELRALGASDGGVRAIRANADSLSRINPRRKDHADYARAALLVATRELDVLRERHGASVDTGRLRAASWSIQADRPLHAQRGTVRNFFESARDAVRALSRSAGVRRRR